MSGYWAERDDPYWVLEVGDEPGSEIVTGPYETFRYAMGEALKHTYYTWRLPRRMKEANAIYWLGQISSLYLVQQKTKPNYEELRFKHD